MKKSVILAGLLLSGLTILIVFKTGLPRVDKHWGLIQSPMATSVPLEAMAPKATEAPSAEPAMSVNSTSASTEAINKNPASPSSIETANAKPSATQHHVQIEGIPALSQLPELPNGCEAVAATMLLGWAGLPMTKEEVADALPKGDMPYENEFGAFVGANPKDVFVGDPYEIGYGIYHTPIAKLMNQWLPGHIRDLTGTSFEDLLDVLAHGSPAMVWATEHMDMPYRDLEWEDEDGELVEWYQPEHALLLTGWDDDYAYLNDPMTGEQEAYPLEDFHRVWVEMGSQAITIIN